MNRTLSFVAWLFCAFELAAQVDSAATVAGGPARDGGVHVRLATRGAYDSNALRNELVMGLFRGDELSRALRQRSRDALKGHNRAGFEAYADLDISWGKGLFGNAKLRPLLSASARSVMGIRFTDAVYDLTFFGNKDYVDRTAVLAPSAQDQQRYQTLGFGVKRADRETYARMELVNGRYLSAVDLRKGDLYTSLQGTYLEADVDGTWQSSDTGSTVGYSNGLGLALDLGLELHGRLFGNALVTRVRIDDLGFVKWDEQALSLTKQEVIHYDGLTVDDILDLEGAFFSEGQLRDSLGIQATEGAFTRALPARLQAAFWYRTKPSKVRSRTGPALLTIDQLLVPGYLPHVSVRGALAVSRRLSATGGLAYGGFGGLRLGAGAWLDLPVGQLWVDAPNLVGLLSAQAMGKALDLGFSLAF